MFRKLFDLRGNNGILADNNIKDKIKYDSFFENTSTEPNLPKLKNLPKKLDGVKEDYKLFKNEYEKFMNEKIKELQNKDNITNKLINILSNFLKGKEYDKIIDIINKKSPNYNYVITLNNIISDKSSKERSEGSRNINLTFLIKLIKLPEPQTSKTVQKNNKI